MPELVHQMFDYFYKVRPNQQLACEKWGGYYNMLMKRIEGQLRRKSEEIQDFR